MALGYNKPIVIQLPPPKLSKQNSQKIVKCAHQIFLILILAENYHKRRNVEVSVKITVEKFLLIYDFF